MGSIVGRPWFGDRRAGLVASQAFPEFFELLEQLRVVRITQPFAGNDDDIPASQGILMLTEGLADHALDSVALYGELDALLSDHQPKTGKVQRIVTCQQQNVFARYLAGRRIEDLLELSGGEQML